jgi:dihydropteroate synthase
MALSRKGFFKSILGNGPAAARDGLTAVADALSVMKGAEILRVHRAAPNRPAVDLALAVRSAAQGNGGLTRV